MYISLFFRRCCFARDCFLVAVLAFLPHDEEDTGHMCQGGKLKEDSWL